MAPEPETTAKRAELPMRLTRLRVKNFRSIADIDIPLSPLTVLVGPNGSGKSNVVDALRFVRDVFARGLDQAVMDREGMGVIQRWGTEGVGFGFTFFSESTKPNNYLSVEHEGFRPMKPSFSIEYLFEIFENKDKLIVVKKEELNIVAFEENNLKIKIIREGDLIKGRIGERNWVQVETKAKSQTRSLTDNEHLLLPYVLFGYSYDLFKKIPGFYSDFSVINFLEKISADIRNSVDFLLSTSLYNLNSADLRQPQQTLRDNPFDEKGRNLAAVIRRLLRQGGASWDILIYALHQAVAGFESVDVETIGGYLATKLTYRTNDNGPRTSYLGQESDGTIRMIGLLAALQQEPSQALISIEEPEANIHPGALAVLAGVIEEASLRSQILVTTHSPDMLDHLPVESFLVVEKIGDTTHVGPLNASQIASVRKRLFTPGELFRMEGLQRQTKPESAS